MDNTVRLIIRFVARGFYGKQYVLILDAVLLHSVLSEDDLSHLLGIQRKELRSLCNRLVEDRLLTVHVQKEEGPQQRPISRTYYYIHYTEAIDAIKWKLHSVVQSVKSELQADSNPQGYICPLCKTKYSQLDSIALLNYEKNEFLCSLCNEVLIEDDSGKIAKENEIKYSKLMKQLEPIVDYLKKIDEHPIPENNYESSLAKIIPAQSNTSASYTVSNLNKNSRMFDRNSYLNNNSSISAASRSQATLHVNITTTNDDNLQKKKQALELEEKRKQNALPTWHEQSTIGTKALGKLDKDEDGDIKVEDDTNPALSTAETASKDDSMKTDTTLATESIADDSMHGDLSGETNFQDEEDREAQDVLAAYYEKLAERAREDEDEEDDEDEDEDEDVDFEDIEPVNEEPRKSKDVSLEPNAEDLVVEELDFSGSDEE